jgi:eukaryotic-like serine/threonine-protein kinase
MMPSNDFESQILCFEQDWERLGPRDIADYLGDSSARSSVERHRLLIELICIDLEYRWRKLHGAERDSLEDYLQQFPELIALDRLPVELIGEEYRARRRAADLPWLEAYRLRFAERHEEILAHLKQVDDEIDEDLVEPRLALPRAAMDVQVDFDPGVSLLSDRDFRLRRLIGAGRMGKVYEASQRGDPRNVAVKFLRRSFLHDPPVVRRFVGEARTIGQLRHANIVKTQGLGRTPGGSYFIVMELVAGRDVAQVLSQRNAAVEEAVRWVLETCAAIEHAHKNGVIHCDLKPANLLLDECGSIRVTDFGLARSLAEPVPTTTVMEGTAPFMAPEQACRSWGPIDRRTDVYGIGAVLFALLTGRAPFVGRRLADILAQVVSATPVESPARFRPGLPEAVSEVCRKCLAKTPDARYSTVEDVRVALVALALATEASARPCGI